jgi:protein translocase SEC61 complex gamma subunit
LNFITIAEDLSKNVTNQTLKVKEKSTHLSEFTKIAFASGVGFFIMGFIGFFVKLIFIPINNIIVGGA